MAALFSLPSSSSAFLSSLKNSPNQSTFPRNKQTLHFKTPLSVHSLLSAESDPPPLAIQNFWQWLSSEGIISSKSPVKPGIVREGLGLVAQRNIARNEVVLEVPKKFWINPDTVSGSVIGSVCGGLKPWVSVALFLIREKKLTPSGDITLIFFQSTLILLYMSIYI